MVLLAVARWLDNEVTVTVVNLGGLALAVTAIGTLFVTFRRTRLGKALGRAWDRAVIIPRDERRAQTFRSLIIPDLDAVRADTRHIAGELKAEVRDLIDQHTREEMRYMQAQTDTIRAVQATANTAVRIATESLELTRAKAARIEDVARTVGAAPAATLETTE